MDNFFWIKFTVPEDNKQEVRWTMTSEAIDEILFLLVFIEAAIIFLSGVSFIENELPNKELLTKKYCKVIIGKSYQKKN